MEKINVIIELSKEGYHAHIKKYAIFSYGETQQDLLSNIHAILKDLAENEPEFYPTAWAAGQYLLDIKYDLKYYFDDFPIKLSAIAKYLNKSKSWLSNFKKRHCTLEQVKEIEGAVHAICREELNIHLV